MRIMLVEFSPAGGLYQYSAQLAAGMAELGLRPVLVTGRRPELEPPAPVRQLPVLPTWHPSHGSTSPRVIRRVRRAYRGLLYVVAWLQVARYLRRERPDVVQFGEWRFALDGLLLRLALRVARPAVVADVAHTPQPLSETGGGSDLKKGGAVLIRSLRAAYAATDVVFVLGERSRHEFRAAYGDVTRLCVVPHGDESLYGDASAFEVTNTPETALFFGSLSRYKGLEQLLDAFAIVRARRPSARLLIAGQPVDADIDLLRRRCAEVGGVELRLGYVPVEEVHPLFAQARLVVTPYVAANQSGVAHLAHTLARPVVATDVGDLSDVVRHLETGLLVPVGDLDALATAMEMLLAEPETAARLGARGQELLRARGSWKQVARRFATVYQDLLGEGVRTPGVTEPSPVSG